MVAYVVAVALLGGRHPGCTVVAVRGAPCSCPSGTLAAFKRFFHSE